MNDRGDRYTDHGRRYTTHGQRPCSAFVGQLGFSRMSNALAYNTRPLEDEETRGCCILIEQPPHRGASLSEFAPLTHGVPETGFPKKVP